MNSVVFICDCHLFLFLWFFFFKQKTAYEMRISDWSSDVCSSDLVQSQGVHVLAPEADFTAYPLVVAPDLNVVTEAQAKHLEAYVRGGGHLVLGPRSGMKDDANALWPPRQPGPLAAPHGAGVAPYYALDDGRGIPGATQGQAAHRA